MLFLHGKFLGNILYIDQWMVIIGTAKGATCYPIPMYSGPYSQFLMIVCPD